MTYYFQVGSIRNVVRFVAIANLSYFLIEFIFAIRLGSISLFADSIDFLEDASVNILIFVALGWSLVARKRLSRFFAILLLIPAISVIISTVYKVNNPTAPSGLGISLIAVGALIINFSCAILLARFRESKQSLVMAAYLSARNDALANIAIITAGVITIFWISPLPDLIVGVSIGMLNADAARKVWQSTNH
jgi:Co/Zn/Cd efflux system component